MVSVEYCLPDGLRRLVIGCSQHLETKDRYSQLLTYNPRLNTGLFVQKCFEVSWHHPNSRILLYTLGSYQISDRRNVSTLSAGFCETRSLLKIVNEQKGERLKDIILPQAALDEIVEMIDAYEQAHRQYIRLMEAFKAKREEFTVVWEDIFRTPPAEGCTCHETLRACTEQLFCLIRVVENERKVLNREIRLLREMLVDTEGEPEDEDVMSLNQLFKTLRVADSQ